MPYDGISCAAPFMLQTNFSTSVRGGIYHFNPRLAQRVNVRLSFTSKPVNRWSGQTGEAHSPAAIVLQLSCPKSLVVNKGSLSEQHLPLHFSFSVLQMSFVETKALFYPDVTGSETPESACYFKRSSMRYYCSRSEHLPAHVQSCTCKAISCHIQPPGGTRQRSSAGPAAIK